MPNEVPGLPEINFDYQDYMQWQALQKGHIIIRDCINDYVDKWLTEIAYLEELDLDEVKVFITSPGGVIYTGFALYDALRNLAKSGKQIITIAQGYAASAAAAVVLQAGDVRKAYKSCRFMLHEPSKMSFMERQTFSQLKDTSEEMKRLYQMILDLLAERSGKDADEIRKELERKEIWLSAEEAKEWGLIDKVLE